MRTWPLLVVFSVALAGCTMPEPSGVVSWHSTDDVGRILETDEEASDRCLGFEVHDRTWTEEDIVMINYAFAPWSFVRAYNQSTTAHGLEDVWLQVEYHEDEDLDHALAAARDALNLLSPGATKAQMDSLEAQEDRYGIAEALDESGDAVFPSRNLLFLQGDPDWTWNPWLADAFDGHEPQERLPYGPWTAHVRSSTCQVPTPDLPTEMQGKWASLEITEVGDVEFRLWYPYDVPVDEDETRQAASRSMAHFGIMVPADAEFRMDP